MILGGRESQSQAIVGPLLWTPLGQGLPYGRGGILST